MDIAPNRGDVPGAQEGLLVGRWGSTKPPTGEPWRLIVLGDVGLSGGMAERAVRAGNAGSIWGDLRPVLQAADMVVANLECALLDEWSPEKLFASSAKWAPDLANVGIDVVHLANNHILDYGPEGMAQTLRAVESAGLTAIGAAHQASDAARMVVTESGSLRIGWLAAGHTRLSQPESPRLRELDVASLIEDVRKNRNLVDLLIVSLHWGKMLVDYPDPEQFAAGRRLAEAGASAVLMHHAHILQGAEIYKGVPICYNLGNCIFDPDEGEFQKAKSFRHTKYEDQVTGCVFCLEFQGREFHRLLAVPFELPRKDCPDGQDREGLVWACPAEAQRILSRLQRISDDLTGDFEPLYTQQISEVRRQALRLHLSLIFRGGQVGRIGYLLREVRWAHMAIIAAWVWRAVWPFTKTKKAGR